MSDFSIQHIKLSVPLAFAISVMPFSVTLCHFGLIFFGIAWLIDGKWKEKWTQLLTHPYVIVFLLFFLINLFGAFYSTDKHAAWFNFEKKAFLFALPPMLASIKLDQKDVRQLLRLFIISCLVATIFCLFNAFVRINQLSPPFLFGSYTDTSFYDINAEQANAWKLLSYADLSSAIGIHPAYLSLYLTFCLLLIFHFYARSFTSLSRSKKIILTVLLLYFTMFILLLSTRIIILSLSIITIYAAIQFLKKYSYLVSIAGCVAVVILLAGIIYLNPVSRFRNFQEISTTWPYLKPGFQTQSTTIRASLWSLSIQSFPKINWLLGTGTGDVEHIMAETGRDKNISNVLGTNDPHNQYLHTLLGSGILGFGILLVYFIWPIWSSYHAGNLLYVGFAFLFIALCMTETALELQKGVIFYGLIGSLILFQSPTKPTIS